MKDLSDFISHPANDGDIEGIYQYLSWHMNKQGMPSVCFHYLEVLKREAHSNSAAATGRGGNDTTRTIA
jgi:hypothetical protein